MSARKSISNSFTVNTVEDGSNYYIEWTDVKGVINNIPCDENGYAKFTQGSSGDEWLRATLYVKEGSGNAVACQASEVRLRAYRSNGDQYINPYFPKKEENTSYITLLNDDAYQNVRVKYKAEFYDSRYALLATSTITRTMDGKAAPEYTEEFYAWSSIPSTNSVTTAPPDVDTWSTSIPQQGGLAYLWKQIVKYTYNSLTHQYTAQEAQYYRMNGENGTSIHTKGNVLAVVKYWVNARSALPTSGEKAGTLAWEDGTNYLLEYHEGSSGWWTQSVTLHDGDRVLFYDPTFSLAQKKKVYEFEDDDFVIIGNIDVYDGDAYTEQQEGHLWQWSDEATTWFDLGQFKGEAGVTYYTHIAWANSVTFRSTPLAPADGCLNQRNASSLTGGSRTPPTSQNASKPYRGYRIDTNPGTDSSVFTTYTWELVQGAQGERGLTGKFYYFAGIWEELANDATFVVNNANTPYFRYTSNNETHYWVFVGEVDEGMYTKSQLGAPSSESANWKIMTDDFKYIISEAIFAEFAKLGGAIMSDPFMISQYGTINGVASTNYSAFDTDHPTQNTGSNFIPTFLVNFETGECFMQNATISGNLKTGSFGFLQTSNLGIITQVYAAGQKGFVLREDGSVTFNLSYYDDEGEITNGYAIEGYGGANFVGNGKDIVLASQQVSGKPKTFVIINGAAKFVLNSIPRSASQATVVGEIYVDTNGYVRVKTS